MRSSRTLRAEDPCTLAAYLLQCGMHFDPSAKPKSARFIVYLVDAYETFNVAIEGESLIELWWDGMNTDAPEDLVWRREIRDLAKAAYQIGIRVGRGEIEAVDLDAD